MAYKNTEVATMSSQDAIKALVYGHKGSGISFISQPPREGFEALVDLEGTQQRIRIMAVCEDVSTNKSGSKRTVVQHRNAMEQEERRVWRVLYWYIKAIFEAADSGVIDVRDIIMPYVVMQNNQTVSEYITPKLAALKGDQRLMLGGGQ